VIYVLSRTKYPVIRLVAQIPFSGPSRGRERPRSPVWRQADRQAGPRQAAVSPCQHPTRSTAYLPAPRTSHSWWRCILRTESDSVRRQRARAPLLMVPSETRRSHAGLNLLGWDGEDALGNPRTYGTAAAAAAAAAAATAVSAVGRAGWAPAQTPHLLFALAPRSVLRRRALMTDGGLRVAGRWLDQRRQAPSLVPHRV
jgi:hypothetical protein